MVETPNICRMAIATLEVPHAAQEAVAELWGHRFDAGTLAVAGTRKALDAIRTASRPDLAEVIPKLLDVSPWPMPTSEPVLATAGHLLTSLKAKSSQGEAHAGGRCWLAPAMQKGLLESMMQGELMLVAGPLSAAQLAGTTRVLLRHSNKPVQSHTFALPKLP
jgi:hypothetical protein